MRRRRARKYHRRGAATLSQRFSRASDIVAPLIAVLRRSVRRRHAAALRSAPARRRSCWSRPGIFRDALHVGRRDLVDSVEVVVDHAGSRRASRTRRASRPRARSSPDRRRIAPVRGSWPSAIPRRRPDYRAAPRVPCSTSQHVVGLHAGTHLRRDQNSPGSNDVMS